MQDIELAQISQEVAERFDDLSAVGEHHSNGYETIPSPEIFIAPTVPGSRDRSIPIL